MILIDKHAAHERILFNKLRAETDMPQQQLLTPVIVELTGEEAAAVPVSYTHLDVYKRQAYHRMNVFTSDGTPFR